MQEHRINEEVGRLQQRIDTGELNATDVYLIAISKAEGVPYQRLRSRRKGSHGSRYGGTAYAASSNARLTRNQEAALVQYCRDRDRMSLALPLSTLTAAATTLLIRHVRPEDAEEMESLSDMWANRFVRRRGLGHVKRKPIEVLRKQAHQPKAIREWSKAL